MRSPDIDCTFAAGGDAPRRCAKPSRASAPRPRTAVRAGATELFLTDQHVSEDRIAIAGVLAAAAVHTHLVRKGLRSYASDQRAFRPKCLDTHAYHAVLVGVGATTVNAYLAEAVDRRPPCARPVRRPVALTIAASRPSQGNRRRPPQNPRQDGDRGDLQLSRRL
ncbi:Glutamate synthase large subunit [Aphelenchoides bicaudatus]|nr:Glutamate synthase large subunit [Aphelenchoides bicaudatus]